VNDTPVGATIAPSASEVSDFEPLRNPNDMAEQVHEESLAEPGMQEPVLAAAEATGELDDHNDDTPVGVTIAFGASDESDFQPLRNPNDMAEQVHEEPLEEPVMQEPVMAAPEAGTTSKDGEKVAATEDPLTTRQVDVQVVDMTAEMFDSAVEVSRQAIASHKLDVDVAKEIKKKFDQLHGPVWTCVVGDSYGLFVTHKSENFAHFYVDSKAIVLFRAT